MLPASHPVWALARISLVGLFALGALYITATQFDASELQSLGGILTGGIIAETVRPLMKMADRLIHHTSAEDVELEEADDEAD